MHRSGGGFRGFRGFRVPGVAGRAEGLKPKWPKTSGGEMAAAFEPEAKPPPDTKKQYALDPDAGKKSTDSLIQVHLATLP